MVAVVHQNSISNFEIDGGIKMDERPKRNRDRYNPYYLDRDRKREIYKISIESDTQKISI